MVKHLDGQDFHYAVRLDDGTVVDPTLRKNLISDGLKADDIPKGKIYFKQSQWEEIRARFPMMKDTKPSHVEEISLDELYKKFGDKR
ncbi:hypothetical protein ACNOYE_14235 [Nannocystaceae bacterium ST9]